MCLSAVDLCVLQPLFGTEWNPWCFHGKVGEGYGCRTEAWPRLRAHHHTGAAHQHPRCREGAECRYNTLTSLSTITHTHRHRHRHTHTQIMWLRWWFNGVDQLLFLSGGEPDCRCCGTGSSHSSRWEETGGFLHAAHPAVQCRHWYAVHARGDLWTPYSCC